MATLEEQLGGKDRADSWKQFPWWLVAILLFLAYMAWLIITDENYNEAFQFIIGHIGDIEDLLDGEVLAFIGQGISLTLYITIVTFFISILLGLLAGLGRVSKNTFIRNLAITYVEFVRGLPILVLIFTLAIVVVPGAVDRVGGDLQAFPNATPKGQFEAARSLGMTGSQSMRYIILPQAIRNILPALGNDFIAILKDSSLLSVLAIREITQLSRLHAGSTFRFKESYLVLTFLYLSMTVALSLLLQWYGRRLNTNER
jgi:polar amino acid transport system permease protein